MKKTKILTVLGVLLAMGITACGGSKSSSKSEVKSSDSQTQPASSSVAPAPDSSTAPASTPDTSAPEQGSSSSSSAVAHVHVWNLPNKEDLREEFFETDTPATCTQPGSGTWYCECGETQTEAIKKLGHDFGDWTEKTAATCTVDGEEERACKRAGCTEKETRPIPAGHKYGTPETVAAAGDGVEYTKEVCSVDQVIRIKVNQSKVTYASDSSRKDGTPEGYTKLTGDGQSMSFKFNYTHFAVGQLYLYGRMDGYSSNNEKNWCYYQGRNASAATPNVEIKVNGSVVDISAHKDETFTDVFGAESTSIDGESGSFSNEAYVPYGEIFLQDGVNELIYKRLQTLNMLIKDFVFVIKDSEHNHVAAETYSSDENGHWHACTALGCPTGKADAVVAHTFEDKTDDARNKAATCSEAGAKVEKCSVCGYEKVTPIDKVAHTYPNDGAYTQTTDPTCDTAGVKERQCSVCNAKDVQPVPALGHTFGDLVDSYSAVTEGENQHIAATAHNCSVCGKSALRWSAVDYDAAKTTAKSTCEPESRQNGKAVRFGAPKENNVTVDGAENFGQDETKKGTHFVYVVDVPVDATNVGLAFLTEARSDITTIFDMSEGDGTKGYDKVGDEWVRPASRYGLKVDGQRIEIAKDTTGQTWNGKTWYNFPATIASLSAGVHEIEIYAYGGYRADIYEYQLTGLPHVTPSHVHNGGDAWVSDNTDHWHVCSAEGCPLPEGKVYDKAAHDWNDVVEVTAPTCTAAGAGTQECKICHKVVDVEIPALGHNISAGAAVKNSVDKDVAPLTCSRGDVEGYEIALADYEGTADAIASDGKLAKSAEMTWKFKLTADGEGHYRAGTVSFIMCARLNGGMTGWGSNQTPADTAFANDYSLKVGEKSGTVTCAGKQLGANFGATVDDAVYFEFGTIAFEESDLVNGELVITVTQAANQGYRFRYQDNVRIIYIA